MQNDLFDNDTKLSIKTELIDEHERKELVTELEIKTEQPDEESVDEFGIKSEFDIKSEILGEETVTCEACCETFTTRDGFERHAKIHRDGAVLSPTNQTPLNRKKTRKTNATWWMDNKRRMLRQAGKSYVTRKGLERPAKQGPVLERTCKCKYKCGEISQSTKRKLHTRFYSLNHSEQNAVLVGCIELCYVKRHMTPERVSRRHYSFKFSINDNGRCYPVCQKTLCAIYAVTPRRIQVLQNKLKMGDSTEDKRGKHLNRPHRLVDC